MSFLKLKQRFSDFASYLYISRQAEFSCFFGTLAFRLKAKLFGVIVKGPVKCYGAIHVLRVPGSHIEIGKNITIVSSSPRCASSSIYAPVKLRTWSETAKIIIGDDVSLNGTSIVARSRTVSIGRGTMIASNVAIMDSDFHAVCPSDSRITNPAIEEDKDVFIGENVWLGMQAIILKGARIGNNSVIAAGSVVTEEIPSNVLAAGAPARVIKNLR